jgi:hypothetical protein
LWARLCGLVREERETKAAKSRKMASLIRDLVFQEIR